MLNENLRWRSTTGMILLAFELSVSGSCFPNPLLFMMKGSVTVKPNTKLLQPVFSSCFLENA